MRKACALREGPLKLNMLSKQFLASGRRSRATRAHHLSSNPYSSLIARSFFKDFLDFSKWAPKSARIWRLQQLDSKASKPPPHTPCPPNGCMHACTNALSLPAPAHTDTCTPPHPPIMDPHYSVRTASHTLSLTLAHPRCTRSHAPSPPPPHTHMLPPPSPPRTAHTAAPHGCILRMAHVAPHGHVLHVVQAPSSRSSRPACSSQSTTWQSV